LGQLGYGWAMRILDAQHFGVPQRRRRVFVVACLGDWRAAAEVLSLREGLRGYLETGNKKRKGPAPDAGAGATAGCLPRTVGTICADTHPGAYSGQDAYTGRLIPAVLTPYTASSFAQYAEGVSTVRASGGDLGGGSETLLTQPIPFDSMSLLGRTPEIDDPRRGFGFGKEGDPMFTITKAHYHGVAQPHIVQSSELRLRGQITEQDTCPTLLANTKSGDNDPLAVQAITFQPGNLRRDAGADPSTTTTTTLKASAGDQTPHVAYPVVPLDGMNLLSRLGDCGENHSMQNFDNGDPSFTLRKGGSQHGVLTPMAVRRLTPVECERLQGFPDNWSRISWKGKPEENCVDGPRYKACGNSMAVPVMRWIGERIAAVDATL